MVKAHSFARLIGYWKIKFGKLTQAASVARGQKN